MKLCTTMIASYKRPKLLPKAIRSLREMAARPEDHQVLVRLSEDDPDFVKTAQVLYREFKNIGVLVRKQLNGYASLGDYFTELAEVADGEWLHIFDDDMTIEGKGWDMKLRQAPKAFVLCERYRLGPNLYEPGSCDGPGIGWFVPRNCWQQYGHKSIGNPPDTWMKQLLVDQNGWKIHHLPDITLNHQRMYDEDKDR